MLKVNEGFHHDLTATASDELRGPNFPYKKQNACVFWIYSYQ